MLKFYFSGCARMQAIKGTTGYPKIWFRL